MTTDPGHAQPPSPLDVQDGRRAWTVLAAAFVAMFVSFGVAYSFGAFLVPVSGALGSGPGATAGVFSLTLIALFGLGALSGPAVDRFGPRRVVLVGSLAMGLGLLLTSRATALWQAYVGHGLGVGLAVACSYVPLVAVVGGWFTRRRTLAVGIAVSGVGLGTLLVAPLAADLIARLGWREAYLVLAAVGTLALVGCAFLVRAAPGVVSTDPAPLRPRLRTRTYRRLYASSVLLTVVLYVPFVHLPAYAVSQGAGHVAAAALVGVIGAASILGRLALGAAAARTGVLRTYQGCFALMAGSFLLWLGEPGYPRLVVFAALLGIGYGGFVALGPALVAELFGLRGLGGLLGILYTSAAVGSAIGPPAAGAVIGATGEYLAVIVAALLLGAAATAVVLTVRTGSPEPAGRS